MAAASHIPLRPTSTVAPKQSWSTEAPAYNPQDPVDVMTDSFACSLYDNVQLKQTRMMTAINNHNRFLCNILEWWCLTLQLDTKVHSCSFKNVSRYLLIGGALVSSNETMFSTVPVMLLDEMLFYNLNALGNLPLQHALTPTCCVYCNALKRALCSITLCPGQIDRVQ